MLTHNDTVNEKYWGNVCTLQLGSQDVQAMKFTKSVNYQLKLAAASVACFGLIGMLSPANARSPLDDGPRPVRLILGGGFTNGGDKLATAVFNDGSTQNVRAGNRFQVYIGANFRLTPMLQLGVTAGYH